MKRSVSSLFIFFFIGLVCLFVPSQAQVHYFDYGFTRNQSIAVNTLQDTLRLAWTGGMNSVRFSEIDLNLDGTPDLVAFEKHGDHILPFLLQDNHYGYAPQYQKYFPKLHDWVIFKDYNHDGKADIFTYGLAGIAVYENISQEHLQFQLITNQLNSFYYNGYVNIFSSPDDYLVVEDLNNDGNLDLLNFWVLGKYVHYQRNYGNYASGSPFDFHLADECWGKFSESADNNTVSLQTNCADKNEEEHDRHTGSSMLLYDFDGNGAADLLLGDVDSPHLILLSNTGTSENALMTRQDTCFPTGSTPVNLYSMPAPALVQLPNHNVPSLLVSPSDPSLTKSQDLNSVWQYDYDSLLHIYTLVNTAFLQDNMIDVGSGCYPILFDWNNDGLIDLFVANYGSYDSSKVINGFLTSYFASSIKYYQNIGTTHIPHFQLVNNDFGKLKSSNYQALYPTFGDFDGDGQTDMLCGNKDGTLILVPHERCNSVTDNVIPIVTNYQNIDNGAYSTPQFFDLDKDGYKDLVIGNQRGLLSYYKNISTNSIPLFQHITDTLGQVDVRDFNQSYFGYSVPCLFHDVQNNTVLFCGSEQGNIFYYKNIDNNLSGSFLLIDSALVETYDTATYNIDEGTRTAATLSELNGDSFPELIIGNYAGGAAYFVGSAPLPRPTSITDHIIDYQTTIYPNPTSQQVTVKSEQVIDQIALYDLTGRKLADQIIGNTQANLNLTHFTSGIYILHIEYTNHFSEKIKIIKK